MIPAISPAYNPPAPQLRASPQQQHGGFMRLTPEQEAFRLLRLREAMQKPRNATWLEHQREGIRREGEKRRGRPLTEKQLAAYRANAEKRRGIPRSPETVAKMVAANLGKKRSPAHVEKMRAIMRERVKAPGYIPPSTRPEVKEKIREALKSLPPRDPEIGKRHSEIMKGRPADPSARKAAGLKMLGRPATAEATRRGPTNVCGKSYLLRDPAGQVWHVHNMNHFVRTNPELFDAGDLIEVGAKKQGAANCTPKAAKRLQCLFGLGRNVPGHWKGWTAVSRTEEGQDLLNRRTDTEAQQRED